MKKKDFLTRLNHLIKSVVACSYPEKKQDDFPSFDKPVFVEKSYFNNFMEYRKVKLKMKKLNLVGLEWTYNNLEDEYSKQMMLNVIVYKLFDDVKLRFPLYYSNEWNKLEEYEKKMKIDDETIELWQNIIKLKKYNLSHIGYNLKLWFVINGILIDFINEQYRYKNIVQVENGDCVIDGGACYGDTALYFADKCKSKVFSFEFMDENIDIFNKNMNLNPHYKNNIELIKRPLFQTSDEKLYAISNGPGTCVTNVEFEGSTEFKTISIDDFVEENKIEKIDFIKLDIEGVEEFVLRGAKKTIQKFKPKLAICVYHKHDDLWVLPQLIKEILPDYKLYLNHNTINTTETVVYATI